MEEAGGRGGTRNRTGSWERLDVAGFYDGDGAGVRGWGMGVVWGEGMWGEGKGMWVASISRKRNGFFPGASESTNT